MLHTIKGKINSYGPGYSNWAILLLHNIYPFYELAIVGKECDNITRKIFAKYLPNKIIIGSTKNSDLTILKEKYSKGNTLIYVCENGTCQLPTKKIDSAINLMTY